MYVLSTRELSVVGGGSWLSDAFITGEGICGAGIGSEIGATLGAFGGPIGMVAGGVIGAGIASWIAS